ncbi:MAG: ABC transporter permease [Coriobacteriales bacterium]|nr:ABC transporter permease [Coriobacteriales bacterium]
MRRTDDTSQRLAIPHPWLSAWRRLLANRPSVVALVFLGLLLVLAITADMWAPSMLGDPDTIDTTTVATQRLLPPSATHPLGTDDVGLDVLARLIYGARVSLAVGILAVAVSLAVGIVLGGASGYFGGFADAAIMRLADVFLALPFMLLAILLLAVVPDHSRGLGPMVLTIGLLGWPPIARVFRSSVMQVRESDFVLASRSFGAGPGRIMSEHIAPNAVVPVISLATMAVGGAILAESALSFLGLGVAWPTPSWGRMIEEGWPFLSTAPGLVLWPGLAIMSTVLAFMVIGDGLRQALDIRAGE